MGIQPASDALSLQMELIFSHLFRPTDKHPSSGSPMVRDLDDFLGGAPTEESFLALLEDFLSTCQQNGIFLNPSKFAVSLDEGEEEVDIIFAGIKVGRDGTFKVNPSRLDAIRHFPQPTTRKQMLRWLGLCTSLGTFAPAPLHIALDKQRALARHPSPKLVWDPETQQEFETARSVLSQESVLHQFDPSLKTGILTDVAKNTGMGIILFQHDPSTPITSNNFKVMGVWSIVAKPSWRDLSPIETEILGFYHAWQKLQFYLLGADVIYGYVDHEPFVQLYHSKNMADLSPRMLKLLKDLLEAPFQMCYLPGKSELISSVDALSRAPVSPVSELGPDPLDSVYHPRNRDGSKSHEFCFLASGGGMASEWCSEDPALAPLYKAAIEDQEYSDICDALESGEAGWSKLKDVPRKSKAQQFLHENKKLWGEMGILRNTQGGRLVWIGGERIFVPQKARSPILKRLDAVHHGAEKAKHLARRSYWWPGMLPEIEQHCQACTACVEYSSKPPRQHSLATPVPPAIAHTLGLDFALVHDKKKAPLKVLILTDYLSGYIMYFKFTKPPAAEEIVHKLSLQFHQAGWPSVVCTDGEGILTSRCFTTFLKENGIIHRLSSPEWAPSNGAAEAAVRSFKRIWYRCLSSGDDFVEAWSLYNDTPRQAGQLSPARLWYGRPVRHPGWWCPPERDPRDTLVAAQEAYIRSKESSKAYHPSAPAFSKVPPPLNVACGDHVLKRDKSGHFSIPCIVMAVSTSGRSVRVRRSDTGEFFKRNIGDIKLDPSFPSFQAPTITTNESSLPLAAEPVLNESAGGTATKQSASRVSFGTVDVAEFETISYVCPLDNKRLRTGGWELTKIGRFPIAADGNDQAIASPPRSSVSTTSAPLTPTTTTKEEEQSRGASSSSPALTSSSPALDEVLDFPSLSPSSTAPPPSLPSQVVRPQVLAAPLVEEEDPLCPADSHPAPLDPFLPHWCDDELQGVRRLRGDHSISAAGRGDSTVVRGEAGQLAAPNAPSSHPATPGVRNPPRPLPLVEGGQRHPGPALRLEHGGQGGVLAERREQANQQRERFDDHKFGGLTVGAAGDSSSSPAVGQGGRGTRRSPRLPGLSARLLRQRSSPSDHLPLPSGHGNDVGGRPGSSPSIWRSSLFVGRTLEEHLRPPPEYLKPSPPGSTFRRARFPRAPTNANLVSAEQPLAPEWQRLGLPQAARPQPTHPRPPGRRRLGRRQH